MKTTIITASLTGAITPSGYQIPETPQQIADCAYACWKLGAAVVHLHMRDERGLGVMDAEKFYETVRLIRAHQDCDVILNCTSSGDSRLKDTSEDNQKRMEHFTRVPGIEMGSFDAGSFNWMPGGVFLNSPRFLAELGTLYTQRGIKPEIEVFDAGMLGVTEYYVKKGKLTTPCHYQFCLGVLGGMPATPENLLYLRQHIPLDATWSAFGIGAGHLPILYTTLALGGHIRVGLEDNVVYGVDETGARIPATNESLVARAVEAVRLFGKQPATPAQAREILGIPQLDAARIRCALGL